jgi:hypothetical protein
MTPDNFLFLSKDEDSPLKATDFGLSIRHSPDEPKLTSRSGGWHEIMPDHIARQDRPSLLVAAQLCLATTTRASLGQPGADRESKRAPGNLWGSPGSPELARLVACRDPLLLTAAPRPTRVQPPASSRACARPPRRHPRLHGARAGDAVLR